MDAGAKMALIPFSRAVGALKDSDTAGGTNYYVGAVVNITDLMDVNVSLFSDRNGTEPLPQNGISNVTDAKGVFNCFIAAGSYKVKALGQEEEFDLKDVDNAILSLTLAEAIAKIDAKLNDQVIINADLAGGGVWSYKLLSSVTVGTGIIPCTGGQTPALALVQRDVEIKTTTFNSSTVTANIPTDFPDLQSAVDFYLNSETKQNVQIELKIESGHELTGGIGVYNSDAGNIVITSVDATVTLDAGFTGVQGVTAGSINGESPNPPLFYTFNGVAPQLKCLIDMGNRTGTGTGYMGVNSSGFVHPACGVINAGFRGIQWRNGNCFGAQSNFSGAGGAGLRLHQAAQVNAFESNFNDCCKTVDLSLASVYVSRSSCLEFRDSTATNSGATGLLVRRSIVTAVGVDVSGAAKDGVTAESVASIDFIDGKADNAGGVGIHSRFNSRISAHSASAVNCAGSDIKVNEGGEIGINGITATTSGAGSATLPDIFGIDFFQVATGDGIVLLEGDVGVVANAIVSGNKSTRFADGTQISELSVNVTQLNATELYVTQALPQNFLAADDYTVSVTLPTASGKWGIPGDRANVNFAGWSTRNANNVTIVVNGSGFTAGSTVTDVLVTCIGRWK